MNYYNFYPQPRPESYFLNPGQVSSFVNQAVDIRFNSGAHLCNVFITSVSSETDQSKPTFGDMTYIRIIDGKFVPLVNNTQNIEDIGPAGTLCGHRPSW